jgi:creatinine amidohydrolase
MTRWALPFALLLIAPVARDEVLDVRAGGAVVPDPHAQASVGSKGVRLEDFTWQEAEKILSPDSVVVIPIGAAAKEHGPHLKLKNDLILADYFTGRVLDLANVVVAPTLTYHFYPSFLEYPGSTSLTLETARDMTVQIVRTLAAYGPRRFYALNTGVSTVRALGPAAAQLADDGILFRFTDLSVVLGPIERQIAQQAGGSHADEIETSMILYIDPASVDMTKAVKEYYGSSTGPLSRTRRPNTTYSPSGVFGDATLATHEKGRAVVEAFVPALVREIEETRVAPFPTARPARAPAGSALPAGPPAVSPGSSARPAGTGQDEREIRGLAIQFETAWRNQDSWGVASLWTEDGEVTHIDGVVERTQQEILWSRALMFANRGYRASLHELSIGTIKMIVPGVALASGSWRLSNVRDDKGQAVPPGDGPCTVVLRRTSEGWRFLSFRYERQVNGERVPTHP